MKKEFLDIKEVIEFFKNETLDSSNLYEDHRKCREKCAKNIA